MDQVEVDIIQPQFLQTPVKGLQSGIVALIVVPELGGDEDLRAWHRAFPYSFTDIPLVAIHFGGVDVPVTGLQCVGHRVSGLAPGFCGPGAESQ